MLTLSGEARGAENFSRVQYPDCECILLSKRELRERGWRGQIKAFRRLRGKALVFYHQSLDELQEPQIALWTSVLHRCKHTVLADSTGRVITSSRWTLIRALPQAFASALFDFFVFAVAGCLLPVLRDRNSKSKSCLQFDLDADPQLAYLYPYPLDASIAGGALSHVKGFLSGLAGANVRFEVFSGKPLPLEVPLHLISAKRKFFLFHESKLLSYNVRFAMAVRKVLRGHRAGALYQRHGRFVFAGALLSKLLKLPFILEYNGSEAWMADHWDPARFSSWLRLCEEISISRADLIVVVSDPLKQELLRRGVSEERILVNPNGVDPTVFRPDSGGDEIRAKFGIGASDLVVGFVGTFHYWHGTKVLGQAIRQLLDQAAKEDIVGKLRFLLMGDGLLRAEMMDELKAFIGGQVFFTGVVPHSRIPAYLDAADVLVSPHVPMPDGQPFFGSPTKIFEYMAMGKGIIASNLDQLAQVLTHQENAWLVEPGNVNELASAIVLLAQSLSLRQELGKNARASVIAEYTWQQNAERVLARIGWTPAPTEQTQLLDPKTA
ncbi:MAG TPA: glycosyltransferase family 4 protein [Terriglobales bacterium]|nr:glycosyltransferase family 4 protein [Terriglobales bacterium]